MIATDASAFLVHDNNVYYTRSNPVVSFEAPYTPITALIEGIWNLDPSFANKILRNHLHSFYPRTPLCDGMIRVAAKRAKSLEEMDSYEALESLNDHRWVEVSPKLEIQSSPYDSLLGTAVSTEKAIELVSELSRLSELKSTRHESDRPIGAVLLSKEGELLAVGWNTNATNRILHAEVNLVRNYILKNRRKIPKDATLITSLKPCAMCASQLLTFCEDFESLTVIYLEDDPGPAAQNSVLILGSDLAIRAKVNHQQSFLFQRD